MNVICGSMIFLSPTILFYSMLCCVRYIVGLYLYHKQVDKFVLLFNHPVYVIYIMNISEENVKSIKEF
jgi:hypothetical protein